MSGLRVVTLFGGCLCVLACESKGVHGAGTGAAGTTTGAGGMGGGGGAIGTGGCPHPPQDCSVPSNPCPQGQYCFSPDPCGDSTTCMALPAACVATPTCDCLTVNASQVPAALLGCGGAGPTLYALDQLGLSYCCGPAM